MIGIRRLIRIIAPTLAYLADVRRKILLCRYDRGAG